MARTRTAWKNNKLIAHEALALGSPADIKKIPHSSKHTWATGEPLLNLPAGILDEMAGVVDHRGLLSEIVNEQVIIEKFRSAFEAFGRSGTRGLKKNVKEALKKLLPKRVVRSYKSAGSYPKTPPHMVFKRLFAMKVFIESRLGT